jgi:hypothetical protein
MPRYYQYAGQPVQYNATARIYGHGKGSRAATSRSLGAAETSLSKRFIGPWSGAIPGERFQEPWPSEPDWPKADLGSLGKLDLRSTYFGSQGFGDSNFGGQNKNIHSLSLGAAMLSDNEKRLVMIGVIGLVGWFAFGDKIKKAVRK